MSRARKIEVGAGYAVQFLQRARGDETPYWDGRVWKDGAIVGSFANGGSGGQTSIQPPAVAAAFLALVKVAAPEVDVSSPWCEAEGWVIYFAEMLGYDRSCKGLTLAEVAREFGKPLA